jgi:hypothetical protein
VRIAQKVADVTADHFEQWFARRASLG